MIAFEITNFYTNIVFRSYYPILYGHWTRQFLLCTKVRSEPQNEYVRDIKQIQGN